MSSFDPSLGITYGEYLRRKGIQIHGGRSAPRRRETRDENGHVVRTVTARTASGAIATTINRTSERGEHQDVHIHAPAVVGVGASSGQVIVP